MEPRNEAAMTPSQPMPERGDVGPRGNLKRRLATAEGFELRTAPWTAEYRAVLAHFALHFDEISNQPDVALTVSKVSRDAMRRIIHEWLGFEALGITVDDHERLRRERDTLRSKVDMLEYVVRKTANTIIVPRSNADLRLWEGIRKLATETIYPKGDR